MPVGLRKISAGPESLLPECIKYFPGHIGFWVQVERTILIVDLIIGLFCIEHAEAVMMLRGKHNIFHPGVFSSGSPIIRVELNRVKGGLQLDISLAIIRIIFHFTYTPGFILAA